MSSKVRIVRTQRCAKGFREVQELVGDAWVTQAIVNRSWIRTEYRNRCRIAKNRGRKRRKTQFHPVLARCAHGCQMRWRGVPSSWMTTCAKCGDHVLSPILANEAKIAKRKLDTYLKEKANG